MKIEQHDLVLYAINTGDFYQMHLKMARNHVSEDQWLTWIKYYVMPRYCREIEPKELTGAILLASAAELREYYLTHVAESTQQRE